MKSVKIILLIEFESFNVIGGKGADKGMEILVNFFKTEKELESYRNSFSLIITKTPNISVNRFIDYLQENWKMENFGIEYCFIILWI